MRDCVLVAGAGTMGCGIAAVSALAGNRTILYDTNPESLRTAMNKVRGNIDELAGYGLCTVEEGERAYVRIDAVGDYASYCARIKLVIEAAFENLAVKQELFQELDRRLPPEVLLLSNTSGLRITDIAAEIEHPERALTTHFWLPATLIPLVEVVVGERSDPVFAEQVAETLRAWGKSPVIVKRDLPGQLANRILQAMIREAVNIVETGLATPEDVDTAVKMGMALRFPVWGPLEHVDAVGLDICSSVQDTVLPEISARQEASRLFREKMERGQLGYKTGMGFYNWSEKDMDRLVQNRNDFIVSALKVLRSEGNKS